MKENRIPHKELEKIHSQVRIIVLLTAFLALMKNNTTSNLNCKIKKLVNERGNTIAVPFTPQSGERHCDAFV